jgi:hypothetical protein
MNHREGEGEGEFFFTSHILLDGSYRCWCIIWCLFTAVEEDEGSTVIYCFGARARQRDMAAFACHIEQWLLI